jgi:hypothetical protein
MTCRAAYAWMLSAETPEARPPVAVRRHLRACPKCRRRRRRLLRLNEVVRGLPLPADNPAARQQLLAGLEPARKARPTKRRRLVRVGLAAALAGLMIWCAQRQDEDDEEASPPAAAVFTWADDDLAGRILKRDLLLAEAREPGEQLQALADMAFDLRAEAMQRARHPASHDLRQLAGLYERVVRVGMLGRARALSPEARRAMLPPLAEELRETAAEAERLAAESPALAEPLNVLRAAAGDTARALSGELPAPAAVALPRAPESCELLDTLVLQGLCLAEEEDPLQRAGAGARVAACLVEAICQVLAKGDREELTRLGSFLGAVLTYAVTGNLELVELEPGDEIRRQELERVRRQVADLVEHLKRAWRQAPEASRADLARVVQAAHLDEEVKAPDQKEKEKKGKKDKDKKDKDKKGKKDKEKKDKKDKKDKEKKEKAKD